MKSNELKRDSRAQFTHLGAHSAVTALRSPEWTAEYLAMPLAWVLGAAERGELPSIRLETTLRFDPLAIKAWVRARSDHNGGHAQMKPLPTSEELRALRQEIRNLASASDLAISAEEAARRLGCGRTRVFQLLKNRVLARAKSCGRRTMVLAASVQRILDGYGAKRGPRPPPRRQPAGKIEAEIRDLVP